MNERTEDKIWDVLTKFSVAISLVVGSAMIRNEIIDARQQQVLDRHEREIQAKPPEWLRDQIKEIGAGVKDNGKEIREIHIRMTKVESKIK